MEIPAYQPFYLHTLEELRDEISRLGLSIPLQRDLTPLAQPLQIRKKKIANRFCAQPIAGGDADAGGAPGALTRRRYLRYAQGRFGLIWIEMTTAGSSEKPRELCLNKETLSAFRAMVQEMRASAADELTLIIQCTSPEPAALVDAAMLAAEAGFDGVDFQCPRDALADVLVAAQKQTPQLLLAARLCVFDAVRSGFGVSANDFREPDLTEPIRLAEKLRESGLALLNITAFSPRLRGPERGVQARRDSENPDEHPLTTLARQLKLARTFREALPGLPIVGSGFSWLRNFVPEVAAGALRDGMIDFAGLGRAALAYPSLPAETLTRGEINAGAACMVCFACSQLRDEGESVGCVLRDPEIYGPIYRQMRRFDADQLLAGAARCHLCEAAPCVAASPTRTDIPGFIAAFRNGDEARAFEIIRARDPLPEMTSRILPAWLECEGACIETTLTGTPVPIVDLQYAIAWRARERGAAGARIPQKSTGKKVAVIGGGPSGIAAAIRLVELGHEVDLYEQTERLGGVPTRLLAANRQWNQRAEIDATLQPPIAAQRLRIHFGMTLGKNLELENLRENFDATLIAVGLWQELSLGSACGVLSALTFLESADISAPARVAILAGGDAAMDAARAAQSRGAREIFVIFGGPRSAMHWHLPESWFATPGVQAMMNWQPLGYELDGEKLRGVRLRHVEFGVETLLPVDLAVEAMELQVADHVREFLFTKSARVYTAGAAVNGGASVSRCVAEGLTAADAIHADIFP